MGLNPPSIAITRVPPPVNAAFVNGLVIVTRFAGLETAHVGVAVDGKKLTLVAVQVAGLKSIFRPNCI